jgi:glutathione S-transferase
VAVAPFGTTPALIDGDVAIGESNTILRYLAGREGRDDLYGATPAERAAVDWILDGWSSQARPRFWALEQACLYDTGDPDEGGGDPGDADPAAVADALAGIEQVMPAWERLLSGGDTILDRFTIADCAVAPVLWRSHRLPLELERWPRTARLRATLCARPSFLAAGPQPRI